MDYFPVPKKCFRFPIWLFHQGETDFQRDLPLSDAAVLNSTSRFNNFEPFHVFHRFGGSTNCVADRFFHRLRRCAGNLNLFVNIVRHWVFLSGIFGALNCNPCIKVRLVLRLINEHDTSLMSATFERYRQPGFDDCQGGLELHHSLPN